MSDYTIREATPEDIPALVRLINVAFEVERYFKASDRVRFADIASRINSGKFIILEDASGLMAVVYVEINRRKGYFGLLAVDPKNQGHGLGKRLVKIAEDRCRAAGCEVIGLRVVNIREELPIIYRKMGYLETETEVWDPHEILLPGYEVHFIRMEKKLGHMHSIEALPDKTE